MEKKEIEYKFLDVVDKLICKNIGYVMSITQYEKAEVNNKGEVVDLDPIVNDEDFQFTIFTDDEDSEFEIEGYVDREEAVIKIDHKNKKIYVKSAIILKKINLKELEAGIRNNNKGYENYKVIVEASKWKNILYHL